MKYKYSIKHSSFTNKDIFFNRRTILVCLLFLVLILYYCRFIKINDKIIVVIFAGRKKYLQILLKYLNHLKKIKKIDEIHFWQFTNEKNDIEYIDSISNLHKTSCKFIEYKNIYPFIENNSFTIIIKSINGKGIILINDKYELIINLGKVTKNYLMLKVSNIGNKKILDYKKIEYKFIFKIINNNLLILEENNLLISNIINDNSFNSIKIKSSLNSDIIWDYKEYKNKGYKSYDTTFRSTKHWYEVYKFYLYYQFKILIKMDDDICFIDINKFDDYINFIKAFKKNITIPNLINHGVSVFYNNKYGLYPDNILFKKYIHQKFSNDIFSYFIDGKQGKIIHNYFLNNINKFINNNIKPIKLDGQRPSICMFGITKESYNNVYKAKYVFKNGIIPKNYDFFDEKYTYQLLNNYLYPKLICVHYSFGPQRKFGLDEMLLEKYNKIADEYFKLT